MSKVQFKMQINPKLFLRWIALEVFFLIIMGSIAALLLTFTPYKTAFGFIQLFNFDGEGTLISCFSSFNLSIAALLLLFIAQDRKAERDKYWRHWQGLSLGFFLLAIDESASIHELLILLPKDHFHISSPTQYGVALLGFIVVVFFLITHFKFLLYLPLKTRVKFMCSGVIFILGAFVAEGIGGYLLSSYELGVGYYNVEVVLEESFEMLGVLLFIRALFFYIEEHLLNRNVVFEKVG